MTAFCRSRLLLLRRLRGVGVMRERATFSGGRTRMEGGEDDV